MQVVSPTLESTLEQQLSLEIYSRVVAEWELNGYYETTVTGSPSTDEGLFPTEDIVFPRRPVRTGLPKLIVGQGRITADDTRPKYRVGSDDSNYKYYHSEAVTDGTGAFTSAVQLDLTYSEPVPCNKFVAGFETSFSSPTAVQALVTYNGVDWVYAGLHNIDSDGLVTLWLQSDGTWGEVSTLYEENYVGVRGWRLIVSSMNRADVGVSIIQMSPRLSMDLTNRVLDVSTNRQREQYDLTNPIGTAASSTVDIQFANDDRFFDRENNASPINNLIDRNVRFDVSDVVVRSDGNAEAVAQGVYFADDWAVGSDGTVGVSGSCRSKFMQETIIENSFYWNKSAEYIVKDILDRFGHPSFDVRYTVDDADRRIPYVFYNSEETVWEALLSLAQAEQASFYFDEQDVFVWESRDYVWEKSVADWTFRNEANGSNLANLIDWAPSFEIAANKVNIKYTGLGPATSGGQIVNNVVWEHTDTLVVNASVLVRDIESADSPTLRILKEDFEFWPEDGILNIDGEYIRYQKSKNHVGLIALKERGLFGSVPRAHSINPANSNWFFRTNRRASASSMETVDGNSGYGRHKVLNSYVELATPGHGQGRHYLDTATYLTGMSTDSYSYYGAELVFPVSEKPLGEPFYDGEGTAGLTIHNNSVGSGYYFELMTTQFAIESSTRKAEVRAWRRTGALRRWVGKSNDSSKNLEPKTGRQFNIVPGERYRIEVLYRRVDNMNTFNVFVNGQSVLNFVDNEGGTQPTQGRWGVYCRDKTHVRFESAWAVESPLENDDIVELYPTIRDRVTGGFNSGLLENLWKKMNRKYADVIFEDFGPIVHGGHEFDVDYEIAPNTDTDIFVSNDADAFVIFHEHDPFSSKFAVISKAREDAVLVGSDPTRDNEAMSMFIYGRPIVEEDERSVTREDIQSRRRRGLEELDVSSIWIQTKSRAERIADWLVERWGQSNDIVNAEIVLVPHLQVGDLVEIEAPSENLYPATHKYNVIAIGKTVGSAHTMSVTLRRRR